MGAVVEGSRGGTLGFGVGEGVDGVGHIGESCSVVGDNHSGVDRVEDSQSVDVGEHDWGVTGVVLKNVVGARRTGHAVGSIKQRSSCGARSAGVGIVGNGSLNGGKSVGTDVDVSSQG